MTQEAYEKAMRLLASPAPFDDIFELVAAIRAHVSAKDEQIGDLNVKTLVLEARVKELERERDELKEYKFMYEGLCKWISRERRR